MEKWFNKINTELPETRYINYVKNTKFKLDSIFRFDLTTLETTQLKINYNFYIKNHAILQITNHKLFCIGIIFDYFAKVVINEQPVVFLITTDGKIEFMRNIKFVESPRLVYHNKKVYILDYENSRYDRLIFSNFDLKSKNFKSVSSGNFNILCNITEFANKILFFGNLDSNLYDIFSDSYTLIDLPIDNSVQKIVTKTEERVFVIYSNGKFYQSGFKDIFS